MLEPNYIRDRIRTVPDWPQACLMFRDITPPLQDPKKLRVLVDLPELGGSKRLRDSGLVLHTLVSFGGH